jgi:hypothetical protein
VSTNKWRDLLYLAVGLLFIGYGLKTVITQEISAAGSQTRGAAWALYDEPAIVFGAVIALFGGYILWVAFAGKK